MACAPPPSHLLTPEDQQYPHKTYDLPHANLSTLLNLSRQLVTDSQITPIMALQSLKNHDMYPSLSREDVLRMMEDLVAKVRCYGFGAVVEDFEFMDSLSSVLAAKYENMLVTQEQQPDIYGAGTYDTSTYDITAYDPSNYDPDNYDPNKDPNALSSRMTNVLTYS